MFEQSYTFNKILMINLKTLNKVAFLLSFAVLLNTFAGCKADPQPAVNIEIEKEFSVSMTENLSQTGNNFAFFVETVKPQKSGDTLLDCLLIKSDNKIKLLINGVQKGQGSSAALDAKAKADLSAGSLPNGFYDISLNLLNSTIENKGVLVVDESKYSINFSTKDGFLLQNTELYKTPPNLIWGYVSYESSADAAAAKVVLNQLELLSLGVYVPVGKYPFFNITVSNGAPEILENSSFSTMNKETFIRRISYDLSDLQTFVDGVKQNYPKLGIKIFASNGKKLQ